ncbi:60S ribosomal protein L28 [Sodiomyces alkalinus F11]|uniref:60S ribosomal protein L28 n=1 Tax=Sodiomyces alkalinus (strain CBS 110278 / VKM F-3762 / F11) TaxID=1314773 RepID=A0A3N2PWE3_SODAK|nr:60S ribosomal protein L28 [Sodiomyces alkalinus F11]ROT38818.1 60S ribosomal protein L28 [Sodiomyces alkalinus F11]
MAAELPNVSQDLVWGIVSTNNAFLVKRRSLGKTANFSRDPLNLKNVHSRKHAGFAHDKAIGVQSGEKGAIQVISKKVQKAQQPAEGLNVVTFGSGTSTRKTYKAVANLAARRSYRSDLRQAAVERVSALRRAERPVKPEPERKLRGNKAKKAAAAEEV